MKIVKRVTFKLSLFVTLLCISVWHEYVSIKVSTKGHYTGTVIEKAVSEGKSFTYYLYINWDGIGQQSIVVHPVTYKMARIGERFSTQLSYVPLLGAAGTAYVPDSREYGILFALAGVLSKLGCIYIFVEFMMRMYNCRTDRDLS